MRSHLAARNVYRRCLTHNGTPPRIPAAVVPPAAHPPARGLVPTPIASRRSLSTARPQTGTSPHPHMQLQHALRISGVSLPISQRRTFLNSLRRAPPRELKEQQVEPGYDVLLQFRSTVAEDTRRPPRQELAQAFRDFFTYKYQYGKRVNSTQAQWMLRLFQYLCEEDDSPERATDITDLSDDDLRAAREALAKFPGAVEGGTSLESLPSQVDIDHKHYTYHLELCKEIYAELQKRGPVAPVDFKRHVAVLCQYGEARGAAKLLTEYLASTPGAEAAEGGRSGAASRRTKELQVLVLSGLAREGWEKDLLREAAAAEAAGLEYMPLFHEIMTTFYAQQNSLAKTKEWFQKPIAGQRLPTPRAYSEILAFAQRNTSSRPGTELTAKQKWVQATFQTLCDTNPSKELWDVIFQWAVVSLGKGVDEIRHMMATMAKHNANRPNMEPDAATINGLMRVAAANGDALLAERFVQLGADLGIEADVNTYIQQLSFRIDANDLSGAYASFRHLQNLDCADDEDAPVINKYVQALCTGPNGNGHGSSGGSGNSQINPNLRRIRDVLDTVEERQVALDPETVVALCMVFLHNDRQFEVIDVLSVHALQYSVEERAVVREAFVEYIIDRSNVSTARAWDAYSLLRQYFAETPPASRERLMDGFFRRRRPDMACYVFGHMRGANDPTLRPTADMYVRCLEGLGRWPHIVGLQMVHNMLKMDTQVQMNTRLYNALMMAYGSSSSAFADNDNGTGNGGGSNDPTRALDFWQDISVSVEGPSYNSLAIVFWVCERIPFGDAPARSIWAKMQHMEIDVPPFVFDAYCGAIAGQGHVQEVQKLIGGMVKSVGHEPTYTTLGITHNALPGQNLQDEFAKWADAEYPRLWEQTKKCGCKTTTSGLRKYKISRELKA